MVRVVVRKLYVRVEADRAADSAACTAGHCGVLKAAHWFAAVLMSRVGWKLKLIFSFEHTKIAAAGDADT